MPTMQVMIVLLAITCKTAIKLVNPAQQSLSLAGPTENTLFSQWIATV